LAFLRGSRAEATSRIEACGRTRRAMVKGWPEGWKIAFSVMGIS
jgi:hypothetical protein